MIYYGALGVPVGSSEGEWLFDEDGHPIGRIYSGAIYGSSNGKRLGSITQGAVYNESNQIRAFSERFRLNMLSSVPQKLAPMPPKLKPFGTAVVSEPPANLPEALNGMSLCSSLSELKD